MSEWTDVRTARKQLESGAKIVGYRMTLLQAEQDPKVRASIEKEEKKHRPNAFAAARLAQAAGFNIELKVNEWNDGEIWASWHVSAPANLERKIEALVWDYPSGEMEHSLTRSTTIPGWQLTHWGVDGSPYGHSEIHGDIAGAFDDRATASGEPVTGLTQVVFRDGRALVRAGAKQIAFNPRKKPNKSHDEADLSYLLLAPGSPIMGRYVGDERGKPAKNGIAVFISPNQVSYRYVLYEDRVPISALQVVRMGNSQHGQISNVYTRPDRRAQGLASMLEARAKKDFDVISHSPHLTTAGAAFKRKLMR